MASLQDHNVPTGSTSNPEPPPWAGEVAASLATRPSRASSLVSTRTKFSITTFQEDAKSIDLSISGQHFRISRDGSKVTSINNGESLPPYPFSPVQESLQNAQFYHRHAISDPGSATELRNKPVEEAAENPVPLPAQSNSASSTPYVDPARHNPSEADVSFSVLPPGTPELSEVSEQPVNNRLSGLDGLPERANTLTSMAVRIQRAWRNYVQYRNPSPKPDDPSSSPKRTTDQSRTVAPTGLSSFTTATFRQPGQTSPKVRWSDTAPVSVPVPNRSVSFRDKALPIPDEVANFLVPESDLHFVPGTTRRLEARGVERGSLVPMPSRPQILGGATVGSTKIRSTNQRLKPIFPEVEGGDNTEQLSLREWFIGEDSKRFRETDSPSESPVVNHLPEAMDSENDVSNHYTRMIRFIDRDHRRALHARDKEMAELRERLNEKDIVYRQELRARDFLIEDLKKRLDHMEETTETEIERARNQVEDLWESRWKDRDFHLRERMQRMESDMQKTMENAVAERESFWTAKYEDLQRRLETAERLSAD
jgi:hypothetical protein